jgi:large subunit ribosomal protein L13
MKTANKCFLATRETADRKWFVVDATDQVLGRLAVRIATVLMGKHKPTYTPNVDTGDFVVVLNAGKIKVSSPKKFKNVIYQRYSGYPSGLNETPMGRMIQRRPEFVLQESVRRMLPKNKLARHMLTKLKLYNESEHPHQAQQPEPLPA